MSDATRREALARTISVWLPALNLGDLKRVDDLVMYFLSRTSKQRSEQEIEKLVGVSRVGIGVRELRLARVMNLSVKHELTGVEE